MTIEMQAGIMELPERRTNAGNGRIQQAMKWMQEHPGQWRIVSSYANHDVVSSARSKLRKAGFEAYARVNLEKRRNGRRVELWARWPQ